MITPKLVVPFCLIAGAAMAGDAGVSPVPAAVRAAFHLAPFYTKFVDIGGLPIVGSAKVSDYALLEARYLVDQMIGRRPDILAAIAQNHVRLAVMAPSEFTTDIPEHSDLTPKDHWDVRARGLGATEARPAVSCGEENLLGYRGDPYPAENILIHEFGHTIHERGLSVVDPTFDGRLQAAYAAARRSGLWKNTYAGSNYREYWAVGVQCWFDAARENDADHNFVNTRAEIKTYDRALAALLAEVFGEGDWRYALPAKRVPPSPHLTGFDPAQAPRFAWPARLAQARGINAGDAESEAEASTPSLLVLAPNARSAWRSVGGGQATKIVFENATASTVVLDWIDFQGQAKTYFTLRPGGRAESATYTGHVWRVRDAHGRVLDYFVAGDQAGTAVIRESGSQ
ncbi:MAG TPA: hypothetical protein VLW52_03690 [Opitutaceae bacterium]|nr:hypothetical protein [Opitutaceae bacterium]